jgi:hypothetical protein
VGMGLVERSWVFVITIVCSAVLVCSAEAAECSAPGYAALRIRLVAQHERNKARLVATSDYSLIPGIIAFQQKAQETMKRFFASTNGKCSMSGSEPGFSAAELEARLRQQCTKNGCYPGAPCIRATTPEENRKSILRNPRSRPINPNAPLGPRKPCYGPYCKKSPA